MYLVRLEHLLNQENPNMDHVSLFLNLLCAVQDEEFAFDHKRPRPRWNVDFRFLNVKAHRNVMLMQIADEKETVDLAAQEIKQLDTIVDENIKFFSLCQIHQRLFYGRENVGKMACRFLWNDEVIEDQMFRIEATLTARETIQGVHYGKFSSRVRKEDVLGITCLSLEEMYKVITHTIVDMLVALGMKRLTSNRIFQPGKTYRTPCGISQVKTARESFIKIQDAEGKDYLILSRESKFYLDDLTL
jgi:hypothetical protein